jgi:hypothetical protein
MYRDRVIEFAALALTAVAIAIFSHYGVEADCAQLLTREPESAVSLYLSSTGGGVIFSPPHLHSITYGDGLMLLWG